MRREFILGILIGLFGPSAAQAGAVPNGGFEQWSKDGPAGWKSDAVSESKDARSGKSALRLSAKPYKRWFTARADLAQPVLLEGKGLYVLTVWAKGTGDFGIGVYQRSAERWPLTAQWQPYKLHIVVEADKGLRTGVRLAVHEKGSVAHIDDVTIRRVGPLTPLGKNQVPNGDMTRDSNGDGSPDGWTVSLTIGKDAKRLARGPDGSPALVGVCASAESRNPSKPDVKTWWDATKLRPVGGGWCTGAGTPRIPIDNGRTYEIRYQTRGQGVRKPHTKLRWLDADGKNVRWFSMGPRHEGDWPWEEVRLLMPTPPVQAKFMTIEFWSIAAGGVLWVDNVSIRATSEKAPGAQARNCAGKYTVTPLKVAGKLPNVSSGTATARKPQRARFASRPKSRVAVAADGIRVELTSGLTLTLLADGNKLLGVGPVKLGTLDLRNPKAPPIAPLVKTADGRKHASCRYVKHAIAPDGTVTIQSLLRSASGKNDKLDWVFRPVTRTIAGREHVGFAYQYVVSSPDGKVVELTDRATWELGGRAEGLTTVTQGAYLLENVFTISPQCVYGGRGGMRFAHGDGFDYQFGPEGGLVVFFDERIFRVRTDKSASLEWLTYRDQHPLPPTATAATPLKCVLYSREGSHDEWTRLKDAIYQQHADYWGIVQHTPLPIINCNPPGYRFNLPEDAYTQLLDEVPKVAKLGFKIFAIHSPWGHRGACGPEAIVASTRLGGTKSIKALCDAADKHGMSVQAWIMAAHLWKDSPLFKQNPGWVIHGPDGKLPTQYCAGALRGCRFRGGWLDYAVNGWKRMRDETGLGSVWIDSYSGFAFCNFADPVQAHEQAEDLFRFHAGLCKAGLVVYTESTGTFGIPAPGFPVGNLETANPVAPDPMSRYGTSGRNPQGLSEAFRARNRLLIKGDYYYRSLANKAPFWFAWSTLKETPEAHARIAQANKDYMAVVDKMVYRRTMSGDRGVEWSNPHNWTRVLFSYKKGEYTLLPIWKVTDVTTDKEVELRPGSRGAKLFITEAQHTYQIETTLRDLERPLDLGRIKETNANHE